MSRLLLCLVVLSAWCHTGHLVPQGKQIYPKPFDFQNPRCPPSSGRPGICVLRPDKPGRPGSCFSDKECAKSGRICCHEGCGRICVRPVPVKKPRDPRCPPLSKEPVLCTLAIIPIDQQCPIKPCKPGKICCLGDCRRNVCVPPFKPRPPKPPPVDPRCPAPSGRAGICVFRPGINCITRRDCKRPNTQICCPEGCGKICVDLPKPTPRPTPPPRPLPPCLRPKKSGPCYASIRRWYFDSVKGCTAFVWGGCKSNGNNFKTKAACEKKCGTVCGQPKKMGPCEAAITRWYFNPTKGCQRFVWGGCKPNGNNFKTKSACEAKCGTICKQPKKVGPCRAAKPRWYFNPTMGCTRFIWGGCKPNGNNFKTKSACEKKCGLICEQPKKVGPCRAAIPRWYFNPKRGCTEFSWGGCKPNGNNFKTRKACEAKCSPHKPWKFDEEDPGYLKY